MAIGEIVYHCHGATEAETNSFLLLPHAQRYLKLVYMLVICIQEAASLSELSLYSTAGLEKKSKIGECINSTQR